MWAAYWDYLMDYFWFSLPTFGEWFMDAIVGYWIVSWLGFAL